MAIVTSRRGDRPESALGDSNVHRLGADRPHARSRCRHWSKPFGDRRRPSGWPPLSTTRATAFRCLSKSWSAARQGALPRWRLERGRLGSGAARRQRHRLKLQRPASPPDCFRSDRLREVAQICSVVGREFRTQDPRKRWSTAAAGPCSRRWRSMEQASSRPAILRRGRHGASIRFRHVLHPGGGLWQPAEDPNGRAIHARIVDLASSGCGIVHRRRDDGLALRAGRPAARGGRLCDARGRGLRAAVGHARGREAAGNRGEAASRARPKSSRDATISCCSCWPSADRSPPRSSAEGASEARANYERGRRNRCCAERRGSGRANGSRSTGAGGSPLPDSRISGSEVRSADLRTSKARPIRRSGCRRAIAPGRQLRCRALRHVPGMRRQGARPLRRRARRIEPRSLWRPRCQGLRPRRAGLLALVHRRRAGRRKASRPPRHGPSKSTISTACCMRWSSRSS